MAEFKCKKCECISSGEFKIQTDEIKKEKWDKEHSKRLELRAKQELILEEFEKIAEQHNSHWYSFLSEWHVYPRPCEDFLDIIDFMKSKPIKSTPYDSSVMDVWLDFIYRKPVFKYIECPVCHCKNYMERC